MSFIGTWHNELGSELTIDRESVLRLPSGSADHTVITGSYRTRVGVVNGGESFPLTGFVSGDLVTFCVSYHRIDADGEHHSLCSWAGQFLPAQRPDGSFDPADSKAELRSLWHLVPNLAGPEEAREYGWLLAHAGANTFVRQP